jgi:hypothetical protein
MTARVSYGDGDGNTGTAVILDVLALPAKKRNGGWFPNRRF